MAEIDSLEIKLKSNAKDVAKGFDDLSKSIDNTSKSMNGLNTDEFNKLAKGIKGFSKSTKDTKDLDESLNNISNSIQNFVNNINRIDTNKFDSLADKMEKIASVSKSKLDSVSRSVRKMDDSFANTNGIKKSQQSVEAFMESIKGIGSKQQFFGTSDQLSKEIDSVQNKIEKIKTSLEAYNQEGKSVETKGWRTAQRQLEQYSNYLDNLLEKQKNMQSEPLGFKFDEQAIAKSTENIYKLMLSDEEYNRMRESILAKGNVNPVEIPVSLNTDDINTNLKQFNINTSGIDAFSAKIEQTQQKVTQMYDKVRSSLVFEPTQLKGNQRYTDTYINLEKQIRQAEKQLEKFLNTQERLDETGVKQSSQRYKNIEISIRDADAQLQRLNEDMKNLQASGGDVVDISAFEQLSERARTTQGIMQSFAKALRAIGLGSAASSIQSLSANVGSLSSGLAGATTAAEGTGAALTGLQTAIPVIGLILAAVTLLVKAFTSLAKAGINAFKKIGNAIKNTVSRIKELVTNILSIGTSSYKAQTVVGKFVNKMVGLFKSRVLRQAITQAMQYMKDGFDELNQYSLSIGTPFHNSISTIVSDLKWLGRSIATAFEPIVNVVAPILDFLIKKIVTVINYINQFFSALSGSGTWTKATYQAESYGDAASGAASAQKDLNKSIREWDKL